MFYLLINGSSAKLSENSAGGLWGASWHAESVITSLRTAIAEGDKLGIIPFYRHINWGWELKQPAHHHTAFTNEAGMMNSISLVVLSHDTWFPPVEERLAKQTLNYLMY